MFKFELDQIIYYFKDNRIHSAQVLARMRIDNAHGNWTSTEKQISTFTPFGESQISYGTCHGIINEATAFATRNELIASL